MRDRAEIYAEAKRLTRRYLTGWARRQLPDSAVFYWRCRVTALLRRARERHA